EEVLGFGRAGTTEWLGSLTTSGGSFTAKTGVRPDPVPDGYSDNLESCPITYYNGEQTTTNGLLQSHTGADIQYRGTSYFVVGDRNPGAYIGMNVTTVPRYKMKLRHTTFHSHLGESRINNDVNPAHIIYDILVTHLEIAMARISTGSFTAAATTLNTEGIGLSLVLTKTKKAADWVDEVLRHIDGVLYFDVVTGKYTIKLLRDDYDIDMVDKITEYNSFDLQIERQSWSDTFNTLTFRYTNVDAKDLTSLTITNTAAKKTVGQVKAKTIEYPGITQLSTMELIANRTMKKLSYPLATVKAKVSTIDFPNLHVGDVLNLSNAPMAIFDMPVRVLRIGGDAEDSTILDISGTEDIYGVTLASSVIVQPGQATTPSWSIGAMQYVNSIDVPPELYTEGKVIPMGADPGGLTSYLTCTEVGTENVITASPSGYGTLVGDLTADTLTFGDIIVTEVAGLNSLEQTDGGWQSTLKTIVIGDEIISYKDSRDNGDGTFTYSMCIRGVLGSRVTTHTAGDPIWAIPESINIMSPNSPNY
ncbi:MAG: phage tail protein, partial [Euryarchaeota archaeon]|nr:phage tail protein [Euryarchaeota archaeon]